MIPHLKRTLLTVAVIGGLHLGSRLLPDPPFSMATTLVLLAANLYVIYCAWLVLRDGTGVNVGLFAVGYMLLFLLVLVLLQRESLFILLIIIYASVFRIPLLLGLFVIFVLSYVVFQPYAFETFAPLALAYVVVWKVFRSGASWFKVGCLAMGLLALALVIVPLLHLVVQDSPQTLQFTFSRPDVQRAIWLSLASSAVATLIVAV